MFSQSGQEHIVHAVAAALAVSIKAGAVREGEPAAAFARQAGLGEGGAAEAWRHGSRRAQAGPPEVLVPSSAALGRIASSLDAIVPGLGTGWRANLTAACTAGVTPMAQWLRTLPGALGPIAFTDQAAPRHPAAGDPPSKSGPDAETGFGSINISDSEDALGEEEFVLRIDDIEETGELSFDEALGSEDPAVVSEGGDVDKPGELLGSSESFEDLLDDDSIDLDDDMMEDLPPSDLEG